MEPSPPIAKVTRPVPVGYFPRLRLYRLLDKARRAPVVWITGPPGCGKTALLSSYIESRRLPCLWYRVDEADADLATFFHYLGLAAWKAAPRKKKRLPLLTPDRLPGLSVFALRYFEALSAMLPVPSLFVLDDCHRVHDDSSFFDTVREGISRLMPGTNVVIVSRKDPHSSFARDRANRLMESLDWKDLRLTSEETAGIVRLQRKKRPAPGLVRDLFARTDGWAAGLVLLLERTDKGRIEPGNAGAQMPAEIIDYFGSEIFRRMDEERRVFLLRTAVLPRMTASMAENLTGIGRAGHILSDLNRNNYFTEKRLQREPVYEYHALFREFLLQQASGAFSIEELAEIRRDAAALLEENGYLEDAAVLCSQAGNWKELSRLILSQARSLVAQGRYQTLLEWLGALPKELLDESPWLLYWNGVGLIPFSPAESRARFEEALSKFDARREAPGVFLSWSGVVESIVTAMDNFMPADAWISLLPRFIEKYGGFPSGEIEEEVTCSMYRALSFRQYPRADVELWTTRALVVARTSTNARLKFLLAGGFLTTYLTKDTREAEKSLASLREVLKRSDAPPLMRLFVDMLDAVFSLVNAMHERCLRVTSDGLAFAENMGVHIADSFLEAYSAMAAIKLRDFDTAKRFLDRMTAALGTMKPLPTGLYHCIAACEALYRRDPAKAAVHSRECLKLLEESGFTTHLSSAHILEAHVHHALHEDGEADRHLAQARRIGTEIEIVIGVWLSDLTEAYFHLERKDDASAIAPLKRGMRIGRETGLTGTLLWLPDFFEKVAAKALEEGIEVEYVKDLIRRNDIVPEPTHSYPAEWPWPVKIFTLGRFSLLAGDRPAEFGRKVQRRPLSLLKVLVALGGRGVSEARMAELLWQDADGDMAHKSFTTALGRLRKLLKKEEALVLKEGQLTLSNRHCWVDVWAFERFLGQAWRARKEGKKAEAIRFFEKALSFYRGPFLPFEETTWAVVLREKLRSGFLEAVAHLGRCHEEDGRWEEAASCYRYGLKAEEVAEELYRRLMICHIELGQEAEALSIYRRCRKTLSSVLGVGPSSETRAIAASLGWSRA